MSAPETHKTDLEDAITAIIAPMGYELVAILTHIAGQKKLQVFIDRLGRTAEEAANIGIQDCVAVAKALDEPLDQLPAIEKIFSGPYELEVSSPGIDRPLRKIDDYVRFSGKLARIHVFRPLNAEEIGNPPYLEKNPKQKNFVGTLEGIRDSKVLITIQSSSRPTARQVTNDPPQIMIPVGLISKANLEPVFEEKERKAKA